jgi:outer membrane protein insertion porin family
MTKQPLIRSAILLSFLIASVALPLYGTELYDDKKISRIEIVVDSTDPSNGFDSKPLLSQMKTKEGDEFSQLTFDSDLKTLSDQYDRVDPQVYLKDGQVVISIHVTPKPIIHAISFTGNKKFSTSTLQGELDVKNQTVFNRQDFNKSFNKLKAFYFKKGYFEAQLDYALTPIPYSNQVDVEIHIEEGRPGIIQKIVLQGFTKSEQSDITEQMYLKKYNFLFSWATGSGIYSDEALEQDRMTILNYLHNKGYADARIDIEMNEDPKSGKLILEITAHRGAQYRIGHMSIEGNSLISTDNLRKRLLVQDGGIYAPDLIRDSAQGMKDLYGQKGYIDASVQYETTLKEEEPVFDVNFTIEEGNEYKIGLIHIFGNTSTKNNVILRESLLVPGETFDSRKLRATQQRLEAVGYFKTVNVYAVRTLDDEELGDNYRDVYIEVEETSTGNVSLFMGFSSMDDVFGGLDLTERNFCLANIGSAFKGNLTALRGGGEYFHVRGTAGKKQYNILVSWLNPYVNDSLWRLGVELSQTYSILQHDAKVVTYGGSVYTNYPLSAFWTAGMRQRIRHIHDKLEVDALGKSADAKASLKAAESTFNQQGVISAFSANVNYDSLDNANKPHRGWRSYLESEVAGLGGRFQFCKFSYTNSIYFPVYRRGTLKLRADFKFIVPFASTHTPTPFTPDTPQAIDKTYVPYSERFFLGGDTSMRGYKPWQFGEAIELLNDQGQPRPTHTPTGGLSSTYLSLEYNQEIFRMLDAFVFVDAGSLRTSVFSMQDFRATAGGGLRIDIGNRTPIMVGWGYVFNDYDREHKKQPFFFSMGGQF